MILIVVVPQHQEAGLTYILSPSLIFVLTLVAKRVSKLWVMIVRY